MTAASLGTFLGALDLSVNVALPAITQAFAIDMTTVQWIIISYIGTSTGLQLVFGRLADAHGLKRFYLIGIAIYTLAVLLIGLATTFEWVLAWRVLQAIGYAMVVTTVPALVTRLFPEAERGRALGSMMSVGTLGMITATLGGGFLVDAFGWDSIFLFRVPLGLITFFLAYAVLQEAVSDEKQGQLDLGGIIALFVALVALVLFLNLGGRFGWGSISVISLAGLMLAAGTWFVRIETRSTEPIIALDVFSGPVNRALIAGFLMSTATFVNLFILPFFISEVVGASALVLGILLTLPSIASAAAAPLAGWLSDRFPTDRVAAGALSIILLATYGFVGLDEASSAYDVGLRLAAFGIGMGSFQASNANSVMGNVATTRLGTGAALNSLSMSLGMITSVGIMTALFDAFEADALATSATEHAAFVSAFSQTYLVATVLVAVGVCVLASNGFRSSQRTEL